MELEHKAVFNYDDIVHLLRAALQHKGLDVSTVVVSEYGDDATAMTIEVTAVDAPLLKDRECIMCGQAALHNSAAHAPPQMTPLDVSDEELEVLREEAEGAAVHELEMELLPVELDEDLGESEEPPEYNQTDEPGATSGSARAAATAGKKLAAGKTGPFARSKLTGPGNIGGESGRPPRPGSGSGR
jgi:hypothetical protein